MTRKFEQPAKSGDYDNLTYTLLFESADHSIDDFRYVKSDLCGVQDIIFNAWSSGMGDTLDVRQTLMARRRGNTRGVMIPEAAVYSSSPTPVGLIEASTGIQRTGNRNARGRGADFENNRL